MRCLQIKMIFLILLSLNINLYAQDTKSIVKQIKITTDKAPDTSSLKSIVASVTKGLKTNDEKAIAIYTYLIFNNYHFQYPSEPGGVAVLKELNVYGWSLCGGLHTLQAALWREMGWKWRYIGWDGHTTVEAFYDDKWHFFDVFSKFYAWKEDSSAPGGKTVASQEDIKNNPDIINNNFVYDSGREVWYMKGNEFKNINGKANWTAPAFLVCKDTPSGVISGVQKTRNNGSPTNWAGIKFDEDGYSTDVNMIPGMTLNLLWNKIEGAHWWKPDRKLIAMHTCSERDHRNSPSVGLLMEPYREVYKSQGRSFSSGILTYKPVINANVLNSFAAHDNIKINGATIEQIDASKPGSFTIDIRTPYVMSKASGIISEVTDIEISVDEGKSFKPFPLNKFDDAIGGKYACLLKIPVTKSINSIALEIIIMQNYRALPYLSPGKNEVTIALANPDELKDNKLVITYQFQTSFKTKSFEDFVDAGKEVAKSHNTSWGPEKFYVQKILKSSDFKDGNYRFNIDITTPKGKYPSYPRMISLTREIIGANDQPQALPDGFVAYKTPTDQEMLTLPYPFHMDLIAPEADKPRTVKSEKLKVDFGYAVSDDGKFAENHYIKVKAGENWNVLMKVDISSIKDVNTFNAIKLNLPVIKAIDKGKTKIAAYLLKEPYEINKSYDFKNVGEEIGVTIIPKQPDGAAYSPSKHFAIDITKATKNLIKSGKKEIYMAVTTIPDRTVDEGYTTRVDFDAKGEFYLSVDVFVD